MRLTHIHTENGSRPLHLDDFKRQSDDIHWIGYVILSSFDMFSLVKCLVPVAKFN